MGITHEGKLAEDLLFELTGFKEPIVEIKLVDKNHTGTKTINQVRVVDWVTLCAYHYPCKQWYIVPPIEIYHLVKHRRGQHGVSALETCTLSIDRLWKYRCEEHMLKPTIEKYIASNKSLKLQIDSAHRDYIENINKITTEHHKTVVNLLEHISIAD